MSDFIIEDELKKLPGKPGVYIMHDQHDEILYVGKAVNLKNRVRQYFRKGAARTPKIGRMLTLIDRFEYIVTDSELEALVLESNLIKEHRPKYNTMLMDDKSYPYIRVTVGEDFPRLQIARGQKKDGSKYFGPYTNATAVRDTVELLRKLCKIRACSKRLPEETGRDRPCLYYHIGQCSAPCQGMMTKEAYSANVHRVLEFLKGHQQAEIDLLTRQMQAAAEAMRFEEAAQCRDLITSIREIGEKQKITGTNGDDRDIIAVAVEQPQPAPDSETSGVAVAGEAKDGADHAADAPGSETSGAAVAGEAKALSSREEASPAAPEEASVPRHAVAQVFFVRGGRLLGREHFLLSAEDGEEESEILRSFLLQYYESVPYIPKELVLEEDVQDRELLEAWLSEKRGSKVQIRIPQKGQKEKLAALAKENARMVLEKDRNRLIREEQRTLGAVLEISKLLGLPAARRMESYDISNISGVDAVGSMVVYVDGKPRKSDYRKFRIRTVEGPDDYASMEEVLTRRFERAKAGDSGFVQLPDVILMDGGRGQVHIAEKVLKKLDLSVPVAGMVKDDSHRTRGLWFRDAELPIKKDGEGFKLLTRIQDEVHRFAIEYHRQLRSKGQVHSVLDEIEGIGPARRKALLRTFRTLENIRDASEEELAKAPSMNAAAARQVYTFFHKEAGG